MNMQELLSSIAGATTHAKRESLMGKVESAQVALEVRTLTDTLALAYIAGAMADGEVRDYCAKNPTKGKSGEDTYLAARDATLRAACGLVAEGARWHGRSSTTVQADWHAFLSMSLTRKGDGVDISEWRAAVEDGTKARAAIEWYYTRWNDARNADAGKATRKSRKPSSFKPVVIKADERLAASDRVKTASTADAVLVPGCPLTVSEWAGMSDETLRLVIVQAEGMRRLNAINADTIAAGGSVDQYAWSNVSDLSSKAQGEKRTRKPRASKTA